MPVINFIDQNRKVVCVPGANLREVAQREGVSVYKGIHQLINCHGNGLCGSCQMAVIDGRGMPRNETEQKRLGRVAEPWRLACQYEVLDNITVTTDETKVAAYQKAVAEEAVAVTAAKAAQVAEAPADDAPVVEEAAATA